MTESITDRLRCRYALGPIMENGEPEFGWQEFGGKMEVTLPTPLMLMAADYIEELEKQNHKLRAACQLSIDMINANGLDLPKTIETMRDALVV